MEYLLILALPGVPRFKLALAIPQKLNGRAPARTRER